MSINNSLRQQLITLCRRGRDRITAFSNNRPTDWRPGSVRNPHGTFDTHFTDASAWEFVATQLEANCEVEIIILERPPGAKCYVVNTRVSPDEPPIYIKLQLQGTKIIGRSFHYSELY